MPVYNAQHYLGSVLPALKALSAEWEILVVDDNSPDDPTAIVRELLPRARCVRSARRSGAAGAR